jgi:hypothetical protein
VSEWMSDCCLTPTHQIVSYIMARTSYFAMRWWWGSFCNRQTRLIGFFLVLAHWNNSPQIDMSHHSDTISWFRAKQFLLFLLNDVCVAEKQQIYTNFVVFGLTRGKHANHYAFNVIRQPSCWYWKVFIMKRRKW